MRLDPYAFSYMLNTVMIELLEQSGYTTNTAAAGAGLDEGLLSCALTGGSMTVDQLMGLCGLLNVMPGTLVREAQDRLHLLRGETVADLDTELQGLVDDWQSSADRDNAHADKMAGKEYYSGEWPELLHRTQGATYERCARQLRAVLLEHRRNVPQSGL